MLEVLGYVQGRRILDLGCDESRFARMLQPGDRFLTATISHLATASDGWVKNADGHKHHRPLNDVLGLILRHGLALTAFLEPRPPNSGPGYAEDARCPTFQIDQFQKGGL